MKLEDLVALLGKKITGADWKSFVQKCPLHTTDPVAFKFPTLGICFVYFENRIEQLEIDLASNHADFTDDRKSILSTLPYEISAANSRQDVLKKVGRLPEMNGARHIGIHKLEFYAYVKEPYDYRFFFDLEKNDKLHGLLVSFVNQKELTDNIREREDILKNIAIYESRSVADLSSRCYLDLADEHRRLLDFVSAESNFKKAVEIAVRETPVSVARARIEYAHFLCSEQRLDDGLSQLVESWRDLMENDLTESIDGQRCKKLVAFLNDRLPLAREQQSFFSCKS